MIITIINNNNTALLDLMENTHQLPISVMIKERRLRWLGHAARRSDNNMVKHFFLNNNNKRPLTPKSMPPAGDEHAKLKT